MDVSDQGTRQEELARDLALQAARHADNSPSASGACLNCDHVFEQPLIDGMAKKFCDNDCADDWEKRQAK